MSSSSHWKAAFSEGRLSVVIAGFLIGLGLALNGLFPRYQVANFGEDNKYVRRFDTWTGQVCAQQLLRNDVERAARESRLWVCFPREYRSAQR